MIRKNLPNFITLINLSFGVSAILVAASTDKFNLLQRGDDVNLIYFSSLFVMAAALTDRFDGKLARRLNATSEMGKQLDSLCDLISFGVAPAVIAWKLHFTSATPLFVGGQLIGFVVMLIYPIAGAIRLARFNVQDDTTVFLGVPITLAGSVLTLLNLLNTYLFLRGDFGLINIISCIVLMVILSFLMLSRITISKV